MKIEQLRSGIDAIDRKMLALLEERVLAAKKIGEEKKRLGLPVEDAGREKELLGRLKKETTLKEGFVEELYKKIISYCKDEER